MTKIQRAHLGVVRALAKFFDARRDLLAARQVIKLAKREAKRK